MTIKTCLLNGYSVMRARGKVLDMETRNTNIEIWKRIYDQNESELAYPDEVLVRVTHRLLDQQKHRTILDYGFGSGSNMIHLIKKGYDLYGVEISDRALGKLKERLNDIRFEPKLRKSINGSIPFEDNRFDAVIAWQVLYYNDWDTFYAAMAEIHRVLRPGGLFLAAMSATGDYSHTHSVPLGDGVFRSTVPGQDGAIVMILEENDLKRCFPGRKLTTGHYGFQFGERHSKSWLVSYEK